MRIYLDSNVFISWFNEEIGAWHRSLFAESKGFFERIANSDCTLVLSEAFFEEVKHISYCSKDGVVELLSKLGAKILCVDTPRVLKTSSFTTLGIHKGDAFHVALAMHFKCDCIVTFNLKDFLPAREWIKVCEPSEI